MSNISSAKSSLRAELEHVQSGLAYYQSRVEALNSAIHQLDEIGDEDMLDLEIAEEIPSGKVSTGRRGRRPGAAKKVTKPGRQARGASRLPATGGDFFPNLLTGQKQTMSALLHAAAAQMPFKATPEELTQLRSRLVAAISGMLKSGAISDQGKGRERVYFKA
ncbi:hypothetical protein [Noviherbaspirillum sedimenti]|uniref:Uncharacterized protein n=1 Tax=Noviherbaspirillum sedimenti TaxID=2320865 RepID=A0A3A3G4Y5_9BURK|nr:hypothetical protein [Noviherbaspirillum sedimenti]RJG03547.1 hypothetical protein D3878_19725 [Noviherbaspirillum sedimenti]